MKNRVLARIGAVAPMQRKKIEKFFAAVPEACDELDKFIATFKPFMENEKISLEMVVDSYLEMVNQILQARVEFIRTGLYPAKNQHTALHDVYRNEALMNQYMLGLALSYFLWNHHFQLLCFFRDNVKEMGSGKRILEIGCGHGLFLFELVTANGTGQNVDVVDISQHSINMTKGLLEGAAPDFLCDISFHHCDVFEFDKNGAYDFIAIGEVLEHVDDPAALLRKAKGLLAPEGRLYITTCANCPAIDHVFHFKSVEDIRETIAATGLAVEREIVAPSEAKSVEDLRRKMIDISYAAILRRP